MLIESWTSAKNKLLGESAKMELVSGENITVCRFVFEEKMTLAPHNHENEQITIVLEGKILIKYDGKEKILETGDACVIPANTLHSVEVLEVPFRSYDVFCPIRNDFLDQLK